MNEKELKEYIESKKSLGKLINDMISFKEKEAENMAKLDNELKARYVVGHSKKSVKEDFYDGDGSELRARTDIPIPSAKAWRPKDIRKESDDLVNMLYNMMKLLDNRNVVNHFGDGVHLQRVQSMDQLKYMMGIIEDRQAVIIHIRT